MKETELAAVAKTWLEERGLEVFQEVVADGPRVDLVGRAEKLVVTVECKLSFGLDVIAQANGWVREASESWVAVPASSHRTRALALMLCEQLGIGVLRVVPRWHAERVTATVELEARRRHPKRLHVWDSRLFVEQKTAAPAGSNGSYSTSFGRWLVEFAAHVQANPGVTLGDAERAFPSHPFSGRASFVSIMSAKLNNRTRHRDKRLAGIRIEGRGTKATLHVADGDQF